MYPKVNQHILIDLDETHSCRSVIAEVGETDFFISFPMDRTILGMLSIGKKLEISFIVEDTKYKFKSELIGRKLDPIPLIMITKPEEKNIMKVQQRENFRVNTNLSIKLKDHNLYTSNISVGGMLFTSDIDFPIQEKEDITGTLFIPNAKSKELDPISFQGEVKRILEMDTQNKKYVGIEFLNINQRDRTKILQYCFEKQRQMRMAGR